MRGRVVFWGMCGVVFFMVGVKLSREIMGDEMS